MVTYNRKHHNWLLALKELGSDGTYPDYPVAGGILARGNDFAPNTEITTEDWTGHTGGDSLVIQSDRTDASSSPQYTHKMLLGECIEEYLFMALGSHDTVTAAITNATTAKKWKIYKDGSTAKILPVATLINQYSATLKDAVIYNNAVMDTLEITIDNNGWSVTPQFKSDVEIPNQPNQPRTLSSSIIKLPKNNTKLYIAPTNVTLTSSNKDNYAYDCLTSNTLTIRNNLEESDCLNTEFGKQNADKGDFEIEGTAEFNWNPASAFLYDEWLTGQPHGVYATETPLFKQILLECEGGLIETVGSNPGTPVNASISIWLPYVEISNCDLGNLSGDDKRTITATYNLRANGTANPIEVTIINALSALHYGTELEIDTDDVGSTTIIGVDLPDDS